LRDLAVVAIERHAFDAASPRFDEEGLDLVDGGLFGTVDRLGLPTAEEGLQRRQHLDVSHVVDGVVTDRASEHGHIVGAQMRRAETEPCASTCSMMASICAVHNPTGARHGEPVSLTICIVPAAHELLDLDEAEIGLDAGGIAVEHEADGALSGAATVACALRTPTWPANAHVLSHTRCAASSRLAGVVSASSCAAASRCMSSTCNIGSRLVVNPGERPHAGGNARGGAVGLAGHQRSDARSIGATAVES
jgi:hypothetical protein